MVNVEGMCSGLRTRDKKDHTKDKENKNAIKKSAKQEKAKRKFRTHGSELISRKGPRGFSDGAKVWKAGTQKGKE